MVKEDKREEREQNAGRTECVTGDQPSQPA